VSIWKARQQSDINGDGFYVRGWYHLLYREFIVNKTVLEVGCGLGFDGLAFAEAGARVVLTDIVPENIELVRRVAVLLGCSSNIETRAIRQFQDYGELSQQYDVLLAVGSLHHAPRNVLEQEIPVLAQGLRAGGRWLQLAYPQKRWLRDGMPAFDRWGRSTNSGTPWTEWYDVEKLLSLMRPVEYSLVFYCEFHHDDFNWFDLVRTK